MTPREIADACCGGKCASCRSLPGAGPWCGCCGREMKRRKRGDEGTAFTAPCPKCLKQLLAEVDVS